MSDKFLSTPSARRATSDGRCPSVPARNFYPRPPRGGRPTATVGETDSYEFLSTPSARRATYSFAICLSSFAYFYPRPPRGGRRFKRDYSLLTTIFLSTPSARRATLHGHEQRVGVVISIHALREEGDVLLFQQILLQGYFYPRPPRGGRQSPAPANFFRISLFLSTPSARRATRR